MNSFRTEFRNFSDKGSFTPENLSFRGFRHISDSARTWPLSLELISAFHRVAEGPRVFLRLVTFIRMTYRFRDIGVQSHSLTWGTARNLAIISAAGNSVGSLDIDSIFDSLVGLMEA